MNGISGSIEDFRAAAAAAELHTVELAVPDTQGHLRGKRVPAQRFLETTHSSGANIADAMFVFDMQNDLPDNEFVNMDTGYLDAHIIPDNATGRVFTHRPGYGIVFADAVNEHGDPHPLSPRAVLRAQIERCQAAGLDPVVATELEFYLCTPDWEPVQQHIQYSSLTDALELEDVLLDMRQALLGAGIEVEGSNAEYGPGQIEINCGPADALTTADNTVLFKSIVKQVAVQHGLRATFMPKPWAEQGGSGMHVHTSLKQADGSNAFADCADGEPNDTMRHWMGGLLEHAQSMTLIGAPTSNGPRRIRPYTFAPTHVTWGLDNRTVLARCIAESQLGDVFSRSYVSIAEAEVALAREDGLEERRGLLVGGRAHESVGPRGRCAGGPPVVDRHGRTRPHPSAAARGSGVHAEEHPPVGGHGSRHHRRTPGRVHREG